MYKILALATIIVLILFFFGCKTKSDKESELIGSWGLENIIVNQEMTASEKANFDLYIKQLKETANFTYTKNHRFEYNLNNEISKGTWQLIDNNKKLITIPDTAEADTFIITELNRISFTIMSESDGETTRYLLKKRK